MDLLIVLVIAACVGLITSIIVTEPDETDPEIYQTICLGGHEYWRANLDFGQVLAPKLTDGGKPVKCD